MKLGHDEIHVWCCRDELITDRCLIDLYRSQLSPAEAMQQARFYFARHRHQYLVAKAMVRTILSNYASDIAPSEWKFRNNEYGKPYVAGDNHTALQFNLSHTEGMIVLAVARENEVGIDTESIERAKSLEIAEHFFSTSEVMDLRALPQQERFGRFIEIWTLKEAYIKACGAGLSIPLDKFCFTFPSETSIAVEFNAEISGHDQSWAFWLIKIGESHAVSLATARLHPDQVFKLTIRDIIPSFSITPAHWRLIRSSIPELSEDITNRMPVGIGNE